MKKILFALLATAAFSWTANGQEYTKKEYDFLKEAAAYSDSTRYLARIFRPAAGGYTPPKDEATWVKILEDFKKIDALCKKHGPFQPNKYGDYSVRTTCDLVADPIGTKTKGIQVGVDAMVEDIGVVGKDRKADYNDFNGSDGQIPDRFQEMLFEPAEFRAKLTTEITAEYAKYGVPIPPTYMDLYWKEYEKLIAKTKERIGNSMTSTSFKTGTAKDAVLEKRVRAEYAKFPNASKITILRVVFKNSVWSAGESYTYKGSDAKYDYYKVGKGTSLRGGYVIAKVEGRPDCQAREFNFFKAPGKAAQIDYVNIGGRFIPCP